MTQTDVAFQALIDEFVADLSELIREVTSEQLRELVAAQQPAKRSVARKSRRSPGDELDASEQTSEGASTPDTTKSKVHPFVVRRDGRSVRRLQSSQ
ncbi:MAG: hypothetical protein KC766_04795 [Myxococcales bacterium]|nr:hypothetical protein [Myxococcales bacterium]